MSLKLLRHLKLKASNTLIFNWAIPWIKDSWNQSPRVSPLSLKPWIKIIKLKFWSTARWAYQGQFLLAWPTWWTSMDGIWSSQWITWSARRKIYAPTSIFITNLRTRRQLFRVFLWTAALTKTLTWNQWVLLHWRAKDPSLKERWRCPCSTEHGTDRICIFILTRSIDIVNTGKSCEESRWVIQVTLCYCRQL